MKKKYSAAVVGLGRAGFSYDIGGTLNLPPRSHVRAYLENERIALVAVVEKEPQRILEVHRKYGREIRAFSSVDALFRKRNIDIVSICTPPETHYGIIKECLRFQPRIIFCEKPFTSTYEEAIEIHGRAKEKGIVVAVNYNRRWDRGHCRFLGQLASRGNKPIYVRCLYNKGLYNYASHMVDLLISQFPDLVGVQALPEEKGRSGSDENISFSIFFKGGCRADIVNVRGALYDLFEIEILTEDGIYELRNGGVYKRVYLAQRNAHYPGYTHVVPANDIEVPQEEPVGGLSEALESFLIYLDGRSSRIKSDSVNAVKVHRILHKVRRSARESYCYLETGGDLEDE
ncbi:MAG: Gfo/Idh/MocA family oxidoreductase [Deltaproteobacteria bacterium]|nr:Gfo/Idh/MocA family oxidoreductase [Deltaproteobacteria bacterium]MBW2063920.1 Gfo/Idh/MocA family oxidoreductase [Deltaproteobacteria bacterium]